jgi:membrane-associated phospholipid phosphatase
MAKKKNHQKQTPFPEQISKELTKQIRPVGRKRPPYYRVLVFVGSLAGLIYLGRQVPPDQQAIIWTALRVQRNLVIPLAILGLLSVSLLWARGQAIDYRVFLFVNLWGRRPRWLDILVSGFSQIGNGITAYIASAYLYFYDPDLAIQIVFGTLTLSLMVEVLKSITNRARPFISNEEVRVVGWREPGRSFPSGHTSQIFFLATLLSAHFTPSWGFGPLLYLIAILVGVTRIYVGAHYPRDVLGGAVLGATWGTLINLIDPYWVSSIIIPALSN